MAEMVFFILCVLGVLVPGYQALTLADCGSYARRPAYTDISVLCGTQSIDLTILACPVMYSGYNESLLILNQITNVPSCQGWLNTSVTPPVICFSFPLSQTGSCGSTFVTTNAPGSGVFSDFSDVQTVNISGVVRSFDPTAGTVTYNAELKYFYSCAYPLEYIINNTVMEVSTSSIAVRDNNGSFISTLSMQLFKNSNYVTPLIMPPEGIELRTVVFVQVIAINLTSQYNVLLDQCYASVSPQPANSTIFNLFVSCSKDQFTTIIENGDAQRARFSFPAFRFTQQENQTVATYYLHCITRLCERTTCTQLKQCSNGRRRRDTETTAVSGRISTVITSVPIVTRVDSSLSSSGVPAQANGEKNGASVGLAVTVAVLVVVSAVAAVMAAFFYRQLRMLH